MFPPRTTLSEAHVQPISLMVLTAAVTLLTGIGSELESVADTAIGAILLPVLLLFSLSVRSAVGAVNGRWAAALSTLAFVLAGIWQIGISPTNSSSFDLYPLGLLILSAFTWMQWQAEPAGTEGTTAPARGFFAALARRNTDEASTDSDSVEMAMLVLSIREISRRILSETDRRKLGAVIVETGEMLLSTTSVRVLLRQDRSHQYIEIARSASLEQAFELVGNETLMMAIEHDPQVWTREMMSERDIGTHTRGEEDSLPAMIAPMVCNTSQRGVIVIERAAITPREQRLTAILAMLSAQAFATAERFHELRDTARRDGLTGLLNHVSFQEELRTATEQARRSHEPVCLLLGDLDHFKQVNDRLGHAAGDTVLQTIAKIWKTVLPEQAIVARYGGEEFAAVLPSTSLRSAGEIAEDLRRTIEQLGVSHRGEVISTTSSFGLAEFLSPATSPGELIEQADAAMYNAKEQGRNRVVLAVSTPSSKLSGQSEFLVHGSI